MFARISTYDFPPERTAESVAAFGRAVDEIRELPGLKDAYFLISEEDGRAVTITLWDTDDAMAASRVRATRIRGEAADAVGGTVQSTEEYRVAVHAPSEATAARA